MRPGTSGPVFPDIEFLPRVALIDEKIGIRITGLDRGERVTIRAEMTDDAARAWESHAEFEAGDNGDIDVASQAPISGTYEVADPTGLFWSMRPALDEAEPASFVKRGLDPITMTFSIERDGEVVASAELERRFIAQDVSIREVREDGLVGTLFVPPGGGRRPAVVTLGGSGGGMGGSRELAAMLASRGFVAMSLAYFAMDGLPDHLIEIPLEYFERAFAWLRAQEALDAERVGIAGISRGGELVLLLASTFPEQVQAVVAYVPSAVLWAGIGPGNSAKGSPSWSYRGEPLPFMPDRVTPEQDAAILGEEPVALTRRYLINLDDRAAVLNAAIPVERSRCPLLLISGEDDAMWPSTLMSEIVVERLEERHHPYPYRHLHYPGAGHSIRTPYLPTTVSASRHPIRGFIVARGGEPQAHAHAQADAWQEVLKFLRDSLQN